MGLLPLARLSTNTYRDLDKGAGNGAKTAPFCISPRNVKLFHELFDSYVFYILQS
jgi:hypothetical protein